MMIKIDQQKCAGCAACMDACNVGAIYLVDKKAFIEHSKCTSCGSCIQVCPVQAIQRVANVLMPPRQTVEIQSTQTSFGPTIKTAVLALGSTLLPMLISKIGNLIISSSESASDRSALSNRNKTASGRHVRRRFRGGK